MKTKLPIIIGAVVVLLLVVVGGAYAYRRAQRRQLAQASPTPQPKKRKVNAPVNAIAQSDRPFVVVAPTVVKEGQGIEIDINEVKKTATTVDYEMEYQTDSSLEGLTDSLSLDKLPVSNQFFLGTCSAGGACRVHTNVTGGTLTLNFTGPESYTLKQLWNYIENKPHQNEFTSRENSDDSTPVTTHGFVLDTKDLATQKIIVIYNSPGYPKSLTGTPVSEVYTLSTSNPLSGKGTVTIQLNDTSAQNVSIMGWDGQNWKEFTATVTDKAAKADVDLMKAYVVVKK